MAKQSKNTPVRPTASPSVESAENDSALAKDDSVLVFGLQTYIWIGIGVALMVLGMILMAGGAMPSPDVWDEDLIYGFRRITLAPMVILAGLGVITYAILKK
jgi:hypothetical protein